MLTPTESSFSTTMSAHCGKSPAGLRSPDPLDLMFRADPTISVYKTVQVTLANGKVTQGQACKICGRVITVGSKVLEGIPFATPGIDVSHEVLLP